MRKHPLAARVRGAVRICALLAAALLSTACAATVMVAEDPGWEPDPTAPSQTFRYHTADVEVVAQRAGGEEKGPPAEILGTVFAFGPGPMEAEFHPPYDGVGATDVRVQVPVGPDAANVQDVTASRGRRFALTPGTEGAPASLTFSLPMPDEPDTLTVSEHPVLGCTIVLRGDGYAVAIPFRFSLRQMDPATESWTVALLLAALSGVVIWASSGSFVVVSF
jgi:hypothetical protein